MIDVLIFEQLESCFDIRSLGIGITTTSCKTNLQAIPCLASYQNFPHFLQDKPASQSLSGLISQFPALVE
jgi:hypothetical protein